MGQTTYSDLLKHPKWQRRRLEILATRGFACDECCDEDTTLHVHHDFYVRGWMPWEYPDEALWCLCEHCHRAKHERLDRKRRGC